MQRYKIKIEYDGTPFVGWQFQKNGQSVQEVLQKAIFNFSKEKVVVIGAGRTDSGVHALAQVAHFDLKKKIERKNLLEDKWVVIGVASSIPNPGNAKPFDLLGIPLILLRTKKNQIKVYHNVCSHRGYKILKTKCTIKNLLRCPYHSWSYSLEGKLVATPHIGGMNKHESEDFDKSSSGLKEVRSYVWLDMIIVNISNNEVSFKEYIKPFNDRWSEFWLEKDQ